MASAQGFLKSVVISVGFLGVATTCDHLRPLEEIKDREEFACAEERLCLFLRVDSN